MRTVCCHFFTAAHIRCQFAHSMCQPLLHVGLFPLPLLWNLLVGHWAVRAIIRICSEAIAESLSESASFQFLESHMNKDKIGLFSTVSPLKPMMFVGSWAIAHSSKGFCERVLNQCNGDDGMVVCICCNCVSWNSGSATEMLFSTIV